MIGSRFRGAVLALVAALGLGACSGYDRGYGYGGVSVGYASSGHYGDYYGPSYGWYKGYYYPGSGFLVYDRGGKSYRWNGAQQRYWEGRSYALRDREDLRDYRGFRRDSVDDRRAFVDERRDDRRAVRRGEVTREAFRADREADRRAFRGERREDRRDFRRDLRDRPADRPARGERRGRPR